MIHFFPELAALYHRSLFVSLTDESRKTFFDEWTQAFWKMSPDQNNFVTLPITPNVMGIPTGWSSGSLGLRNADEQKVVSTSLVFEDLVKKPHLSELADSLFFELDCKSVASEELIRWVAPAMMAQKKIVWCLKESLGPDPSLHEIALDKKMKQIAPDFLRIVWGNDGFMRDALEWVLSF